MEVKEALLRAKVISNDLVEVVRSRMLLPGIGRQFFSHIRENEREIGSAWITMSSNQMTLKLYDCQSEGIKFPIIFGKFTDKRIKAFMTLKLSEGLPAVKISSEVRFKEIECCAITSYSVQGIGVVALLKTECNGEFFTNRITLKSGLTVTLDSEKMSQDDQENKINNLIFGEIESNLK